MLKLTNEFLGATQSPLQSTKHSLSYESTRPEWENSQVMYKATSSNNGCYFKTRVPVEHDWSDGISWAVWRAFAGQIAWLLGLLRPIGPTLEQLRFEDRLPEKPVGREYPHDFEKKVRLLLSRIEPEIPSNWSNNAMAESNGASSWSNSALRSRREVPAGE